MENLDRLPPKKTSKKRKQCVLPFARFHPLFGVGEDWGSLSHFVCLRLGTDLIDIHSHLNHYSESMEFIFSNCSLTSSLNRDQIKGVPLPFREQILCLCHYVCWNFSTADDITILLSWLSMNMYPTINTFQSESSPEWNLIFENTFFPFFSCRQM